MNGPLLFHVSVALFVSLLTALGGRPFLALAIAVYAVLVALNKVSSLTEVVAYLAVGAFTAGFVTVAILSFDSGRYFVAVVLLTGLAASWAWTLLRVQQASVRD